MTFCGSKNASGNFATPCYIYIQKRMPGQGGRKHKQEESLNREVSRKTKNDKRSERTITETSK